jgi:hypothetical protein
MPAPATAVRALSAALGLRLHARRLVLRLRRLPFHSWLVLHTATAAIEVRRALTAHIWRRRAPDLTLRGVAAPRAPLLCMS